MVVRSGGFKKKRHKKQSASFGGTTVVFPIAPWLAPTPQSEPPWHQPCIQVWLCSTAFGISPSPACTPSVPSLSPLCIQSLLIDRWLPWRARFAWRASAWSNRLWRSVAFLRQRPGLLLLFPRRQTVRRPIEKVWCVSCWLRSTGKRQALTLALIQR